MTSESVGDVSVVAESLRKRVHPPCVLTDRGWAGQEGPMYVAGQGALAGQVARWLGSAAVASGPHMERQIDLTVLVPVLKERENVVRLLPRLRRVLDQLACTSEVLLVDGGSRDGTVEAARSLGARVLAQR